MVPLEGMARTTETLGEVLERSGKWDAFVELLDRAARETGTPALADAALAELRSHQVVFVRGTDALRAFGYRRNWVTLANGGAALPAQVELHHLIPLYLGGGNSARLLAALPSHLHDKMHQLFDLLKLADEAVLAPQALGSALKADVRPAAGVILQDGSVAFVPLSKG